MIDTGKAFSSFAVPDIARATEFYKNVLGLKTANDMGQLQLHLSAGKPVFIYEKPDYVAASYTVLNFPVPDIEAEVRALKTRGVIFEIYRGTDYDTDDIGISRNAGGKGPKAIAWFRDPAGNILSILEE